MLKGAVSVKPEYPDDTLAQRDPDCSSRLGESVGSEEATVGRLMTRSKSVYYRISGICQFVSSVPQS